MTALPRSISERWRGAARAVPIERALDRLLDLLEERLEQPAGPVVEALDELLPLSTGLVGLDHVLGGGLRRGEVAWVQADLPAHAGALLHAAARTTPHACLLDSDDVLSSAAWLVAGVAGVPRIGVWEAWMSEKEWEAVSSAISPLGQRTLTLSSVGSVRALHVMIGEVRPDLVVVDDPGRLGGADEMLDELVEMAVSTQVAVLIASPEALPEEVVDGRSRVRQVVMSSCSLGGAALLLSPDREELLAVREVRVDFHRGRVW